ncbi:MAG: flagellar hook-length control protein FliK [Lachnospiraceae bacterium]|nr:flagellar hook-length control protein FliK [Lachnospiraceae bacterium]
MITISTGGIGPMDVMANTKSKGASKEEEKNVDAFASLMNMVSTKQEQSVSVDTGGLDVSEEVAPTKDSASEYDVYSKQESVEAAKDKLQNTEKTTVKEDTETAKVKETGEDIQPDEQIVDKVAALIKEVKTVLKDALNITDEELENILSDMGINVSDLLIGDNLKNFILKVQGASSVDLLVNEDLANLVSDLTNQVSEIINQFEGVDVDIQQFVAENSETIEHALQNYDKNVDNIIDEVEKVQIDNGQDADLGNVTLDENEVDVVGKDVKSEAQVDEKTVNDGIAEKITVEKTSDDGQAMNHEQTSQQNNQQIATNFNQALDNTINSNVNIDATAFTNNVQEADIIRQIIDQIKVNTGREVQSMEVQLNPENLGKVYVNVETKDGVMQAKIIAETEAAKNAIEHNLAVLKENFSNNELKVEAIEVMVAAYGFFEENQNDNFDNQEQANDASKSIKGISVSDMEDELTEEEELEVEIMKTKGNTVSYTV